jgi:branched-chain amino acid transport system substrate-binding protein
MSWSIKPIALAVAISAVSLFPARSQDAIRIGVLNDMAGPYASYQGPGSVVAAQMAVEDYGGKAAGKKVEVVAADHQNKADVGVAIARLVRK